MWLDTTLLPLALDEDTFAMHAGLPERKIILCYDQIDQKADCPFKKHNLFCEGAFCKRVYHLIPFDASAPVCKTLHLFCRGKHPVKTPQGTECSSSGSSVGGGSSI